LPDTPLPHGSTYHLPVMVAEVLELLGPRDGGLYLDGTLGGGGHTEAILERAPGARVVATDRDPAALAEAGTRLARFGDRVRLIRSSFADAVEALGHGDPALAGALLDLGVSSHQLDVSERGFTFRPGTTLDMRMGGESSDDPSAADLLAVLPESEIANLFYRYGEERRSRRLARVIVEMRESAPVDTSDRLLEAIARALGPAVTAQDRARLFQALRIAVNREMDALEAALPRIREALEPGGVLVVLSYHSLEDRIVKDAFREWSRSCICPPGLPVCRCRGVALGEAMTRKPRMASAAEIAANARARSARLRAWRRR
jgi:16S rRNA (cytosine1402-N4)-methyltransferase